jgi:hypothetical protein
VKRNEVHVNARLLVLLLVAAIVVGVAGTRVADGQGAPPGPPRSAVAQGAAAPALPRTPDGQPDLQGIWTNLTVTPLERPASLGDKAFFTESEAAEFERGTAERAGRAARSGEATGPVYNNFVERGDRVVRTRRTSLVVDPPDGRIPPLTPAAQQLVAANETALNARGPESHDDLSAYIRCLTRGLPLSMLPGGSNSNYEIVQVPGLVAISMEMIHDVRIIPLDRPSHPPSAVRLWLGDSRGHWEGNTLVVDTTNFSDRPVVAFTASPIYKWIPQTTLHLVERFTRVDADTMDYQFTVDDPATFTRPWTVMLTMRRTRGPLFEYSCHEGNEADVEAILNGTRAQQKRASDAARKQSN